MVRHISVLTFLDTPEKEQNIASVRAYLERVPEMYPAIRNSVVAVPVLDTPFVPDNAPVMFGDLVQVLDFDTVEDAANYPTSKAHTDLAAMSTAMLKKVTAIDYQM